MDDTFYDCCKTGKADSTSYKEIEALNNIDNELEKYPERAIFYANQPSFLRNVEQ